MPTNHVVKLARCRALEELRAGRPLAPHEYKRLRGMVADLDLGGAPFDEVSHAYPLMVPREPRVRVFAEDPRCVSVGLRLAGRGFVGVVGDATFEAACLAHPGSIVFAVGRLEERSKGDRTYLNLRPRGWLVAELEDP